MDEVGTTNESPKRFNLEIASEWFMMSWIFLKERQTKFHARRNAANFTGNVMTYHSGYLTKFVLKMKLICKSVGEVHLSVPNYQKLQSGGYCCHFPQSQN